MLYLRRYDRIDLARPVTRANGGAKLVDGFVASAGILDYDRPDGTVLREYVPAETLQASAAELVGLPVTMEHPPVDVTPDNYERYAVGTVVSAEYDSETKAIRCTLAIQRRDILDAVDGGKIELSPGYMATVEDKPGSNEHGEFDAVQVGREYNHVAFVDEARGGPHIRARVDGARNSITDAETETITMDPRLIALCARLGLGTDFATDAEMVGAIGRRVDSMSAEMEQKDTEIAELQKDTEAVEKIDAEEYQRLKDENVKMKEMLDGLMSQREMDAVKPFMDAYGVKEEQGDRADAVYCRIAEKITGEKVAEGTPIERTKGLVHGHYEARKAREDGIRAGRDAWSPGNSPASQPRQDSQGTDDLFRPGLAAKSEARADSAFVGRRVAK